MCDFDSTTWPWTLPTGLSRGATAKALAQLERGGFLDRKTERGPSSARHVTDAAGLLDRSSTAVAALVDKTPAIRLHRTATAGPVIDGLRCAPPARVYADLLAKGGALLKPSEW